MLGCARPSCFGNIDMTTVVSEDDANFFNRPDGLPDGYVRMEPASSKKRFRVRNAPKLYAVKYLRTLKNAIKYLKKKK